MPTVSKICEFCKKEMSAKSKLKRFCNRVCQRKHYYLRPEIHKKIIEYGRHYNRRQEVMERNRKRVKNYRQRPEVKERNRILAVTRYREQRKAFWKEYGKRPEIRARVRERERWRLQFDKEYAIADRLRRSLNHAMNNYTKTGKIMSSKKYGINWGDIIKSLKPFPENLKEFEIDHTRPLHSFTLENPEEVKKAFSPSNLQWLKKEENRRKGGKL